MIHPDCGKGELLRIHAPNVRDVQVAGRGGVHTIRGSGITPGRRDEGDATVVERILAWHFLANNGRMRDGTPVEVGRTYRGGRSLVLCKKGLHASVRALDALKYAPGSIVCLVECGGKIIHGSDKLVCSERRVLSMASVVRELNLFACDAAESVQSGDADPRSLAAIRAKRAWIEGQISDGALYDAIDAAWEAAEEDGWTYESAAAWAASWRTSSSSARCTSQFVARAAASSASWDASSEAAWSDLNAEFEGILRAKLGYPVCAVDGDSSSED